MSSISNTIIYIFLFTSLYYEVFLLITYFEKRLLIKEENKPILGKLKKFPSVSVLVPCWNEETTLGKTVHSLLNLDYPKDKLKILIIDDGSTDNTWEVAQKFKHNLQVEIYKKENGGKYTALNFGLSKVTSDLVGCLDADSYVDKDALRHIVYYFQQDKELMAVTPSVHVWKPKTIIQIIQRVEYAWGIFVRKMFSYLNAMYVTPGPFSIFKRELFDKVGPYRHAYQTEDMELALRIQSNHYKMINAHNAKVYTVAPNTLYKLYKQRLRWTFGYIKNAIDYKHLFFNKEYGNLGFFVLPIASISIVSAIYVVCTVIASFSIRIYNTWVKFQTVGFDFNFHTHLFDPFFINTQFIAVMSVIAFCGTLTLIFLSRKMAEGHMRPGIDLVYFLVLYAFIAPLWLTKAVYNALFSVKTQWR